MIHVIGDIMLDRWIFGKIDRISPEAPVPILLQTSENFNLGGAGNVALNIGNINDQVDLYGSISNDAEGLKILDLFLLRPIIGKSLGLIFDKIKIYIIKKNTKRRPGSSAPAKRSIAVTGKGARLPINNPASSLAPCNISAKRIKTIEGGIIWPNVPAAQIVPVATFSL